MLVINYVARIVARMLQSSIHTVDTHCCMDAWFCCLAASGVNIEIGAHY